MGTPVNLENVHSFTSGDVEMEKALFKEFLATFEVGMASLQANIAETAVEAWREHAYELKGMALNMGAMKLGALCEKGQSEPHANADVKSGLLKNIQAEYERVRQFLLKTTNA